MKKILVTALFALSASSTFAAPETCYDISPNGTVWSRTPELICLSPANAQGTVYDIEFRTGLLPQTIASFKFDLLERKRSMDVNQATYGIANPSNSTFNALRIKFDGKIDHQTHEQEGTVEIGATKLYYRSR